jgi:hypothetical protein
LGQSRANRAPSVIDPWTARPRRKWRRRRKQVRIFIRGTISKRVVQIAFLTTAKSFEKKLSEGDVFRKYNYVVMFSPAKALREEPFLGIATKQIFSEVKFDWTHGQDEDRLRQQSISFKKAHGKWEAGTVHVCYVFLKCSHGSERTELDTWIDQLRREFYHPSPIFAATMSVDVAMDRYGAMVRKYYRAARHNQPLLLAHEKEFAGVAATTGRKGKKDVRSDGGGGKNAAYCVMPAGTEPPAVVAPPSPVHTRHNKKTEVAHEKPPKGSGASVVAASSASSQGTGSKKAKVGRPKKNTNQSASQPLPTPTQNPFTLARGTSKGMSFPDLLGVAKSNVVPASPQSNAVPASPQSNAGLPRTESSPAVQLPWLSSPDQPSTSQTRRRLTNNDFSDISDIKERTGKSLVAIKLLISSRIYLFTTHTVCHIGKWLFAGHLLNGATELRDYIDLRFNGLQALLQSEVGLLRAELKKVAKTRTVEADLKPKSKDTFAALKLPFVRSDEVEPFCVDADKRRRVVLLLLETFEEGSGCHAARDVVRKMMSPIFTATHNYFSNVK